MLDLTLVWGHDSPATEEEEDGAGPQGPWVSLCCHTQPSFSLVLGTCVCTLTCMHVHIHSYACLHSHSRAHPCTLTHRHVCKVHTCKCTHIHVHAHTLTCTCLYIYSHSTHICTHVYTRAHTTTRALTHKPVHTHTCAHSPTRSHVRTHNIHSHMHAHMCLSCVTLGVTRVIQVCMAPVPIMSHQRPPLYTEVQWYSDAPSLCFFRARRGHRGV